MMAATRAQLGVTAGVGRNERRRRVGVVVDGEQQGKVSLAAPRPYPGGAATRLVGRDALDSYVLRAGVAAALPGGEVVMGLRQPGRRGKAGRLMAAGRVLPPSAAVEAGDLERGRRPPIRERQHEERAGQKAEADSEIAACHPAVARCPQPGASKAYAVLRIRAARCAAQAMPLSHARGACRNGQQLPRRAAAGPLIGRWWFDPGTRLKYASPAMPAGR